MDPRASVVLADADRQHLADTAFNFPVKGRMHLDAIDRNDVVCLRSILVRMDQETRFDLADYVSMDALIGTPIVSSVMP